MQVGERGRRRGRERERTLKQSPCWVRRPHMGFDRRTLRSGPGPKSPAGCLTTWATQIPWCPFLYKWPHAQWSYTNSSNKTFLALILGGPSGPQRSVLRGGKGWKVFLRPSSDFSMSFPSSFSDETCFVKENSECGWSDWFCRGSKQE